MNPKITLLLTPLTLDLKPFRSLVKGKHFSGKAKMKALTALSCEKKQIVDIKIIANL